MINFDIQFSWVHSINRSCIYYTRMGGMKDFDAVVPSLVSEMATVVLLLQLAHVQFDSDFQIRADGRCLQEWLSCEARWASEDMEQAVLCACWR